ncbi:DUF443 family protein [Macrococcus capreoli]|uniref:DUF443 family protein n=1 Tax=Macrococcus capreoli TaxID=2982690 RepID=UPI003EE7E4BC
MFGNILHRTIKYRYRFLNIDQKEYLLDMNDNKLAFIFPFIHIFTGVKAFELTYEESLKIGYDKKRSGAFNGAAIGIGIILGVLLRPYYNLFNFMSNNTVNFILLFFILIFTCIIRFTIAAKAKIKFEVKSSPLLIRIKPKFKDILLVTTGYLYLLLLVFIGIRFLLFFEHNLLFLLGIFLFSYFLTIFHFS